MSPLVPAVILLHLLAAAPSSCAAAPNPFFERLRAARAELARGNLAAAKAGFEEADSVASGLPVEDVFHARGAPVRPNERPPLKR